MWQIFCTKLYLYYCFTDSMFITAFDTPSWSISRTKGLKFLKVLSPILQTNLPSGTVSLAEQIKLNKTKSLLDAIFLSLILLSLVLLSLILPSLILQSLKLLRLYFKEKFCGYSICIAPCFAMMIPKYS